MMDQHTGVVELTGVPLSGLPKKGKGNEQRPGEASQPSVAGVGE